MDRARIWCTGAGMVVLLWRHAPLLAPSHPQEAAAKEEEDEAEEEAEEEEPAEGARRRTRRAA